MLDGKYEITSEQELAGRETLFGATAPDGTALSISWYDLETPAEERAFERYRALLRQLRRGGHAALYDLVSRPGAHYVAWRVPGETGAQPVAGRGELGAIGEILAAHDRQLGEAQICALPGAPPQVYALSFAAVAGAAVTSSPTEPVTVRPAPIINYPVNGSFNHPVSVWAAFRPWAPACLLGLLGLLFLLLSLNQLLRPELVSVPDVRGQEINTALKRLQDAGFRSTAVPLTSLRAAGEVLEVRPEAGTSLRPGRTLSVRYALPAGRSPEVAPDVVGTTLTRAETVLSDAGFRVGSVARSYSSAPRETVVSQIPAAAAPVTQGGRFALLVSDGPLGELTFLPDLNGLPLEDALALAEAAGFARGAVRLERTPGNGIAAGTVLAQNIEPYIDVPLREAQLRLTLAAASSTPAGEGTGTPDLTGLDLGSAQRQARALGLSVVVSGQVSAPELPSGVVVQRPEPGAPLPETVQVTLNRAPLEIPIPRVVATVQQVAVPEVSVRRARYVWQLGQDAGGRVATITVTLADGTQETILRGQEVAANERLEGTYLTTATGPLVFRLTLDGELYGSLLTVR